MKRIFNGILLAGALIFLSIPVLSQGFLHTQNKYIFDGNNQEVILRGIGTGNWMLMEGYMMKTADFAGTHTMFRDLLTETVGEQNTEIFFDKWLDNHYTRRDVDSMKAWGFNSVRVAMHYKWFTLPIEQEPVSGQDTWFEEGFVRIDSLLDWCGDNEMYLILDMHGAPGGQGHDRPISDYDPDYPSLWESSENRRKLTALWKKLAQRYVNEPWMGGYDLINEPNWDLPGGTLLRQTYVDITNAIRSVDQNHMIIIEGNWFANDYTGLTPPWDDNIVYSFHKYWNYNTQDAIQWMINIRNSHNVPIWLGETGENSNSWFTDIIKLAEANKIGWSMWPVKKAGINNVLMVPESAQYGNLLSYWQYGTPSMTPQQAFAAVMDWANNHRIENCIVQRDVIDAMIRQPHSSQPLPFKDHSINELINLVDYDLGKCSVGYWDTDTANYRLNTNVFTNWNEGWSYRNDGVDIQACTDANPSSNGFNVGWTAADEWLQYTVTTDSAAAYQLILRSACASGPSAVHLEINGTAISPQVQLPVTGGWQTWVSTMTENVIIPAGENRIRLYFDKGASNMNLMGFINPKPVNNVPFTYLTGKTNINGAALVLTLNKSITSENAANSDFTVKVNGIEREVSSVSVNTINNRQLVVMLAEPVSFGQTITISYSGNMISGNEQILEAFTDMPVKNTLPRRVILPAVIQAEDFDFNFGFQLEDCSDTGGGKNTGYANNGDYLDYYISVPQEAQYIIRFRVASQYSNGSISIRLGDLSGTFTTIQSVNFTGTGGWQNWTTQSHTITLPAGNYTLRLYSLSGEYNINWFELALPADVNEIPDLKNFRVFPNPSDGLFYIEAEFESSTAAGLTFYDLRGNELMNYNLGKILSFSKEIDYSGCEPGIYFICLSTEVGMLARKVVVN